MATGKIVPILNAAGAVAVLSFAAGIYSVGHLGGWLKSGLDAASPNAKAQESNLRIV
jgi:hypothetical protein